MPTEHTVNRRRFLGGGLAAGAGLIAGRAHAELPPPVGPEIMHAPLIVPVSVLLIGLGALVASTLRHPERRRDYAFYWAWLLVPLVALSTRELKFPRYVFYVMPVLALVMAHGVASLGRGRGTVGRVVVFVLAYTFVVPLTELSVQVLGAF